jgi:hypothetical protein|tara:strand:+ start:360 stop:500 length:141 start_codon:yes stop_codon:yes gene_type:complete
VIQKSENSNIPKKRRENPVFTIWVHVGYTILVISMATWMIYIEFLI